MFGGGGGEPDPRFDPVEPERLADTLDVDAGLRLLYSTKNVAVYATFLNVQVTERGNLLIFIADFGEDQDEVNFVYSRPGERRPIADPGWHNGFGLPGSKIVRLSEGVYTMTVDTTGFRGGKLKWHFYSTGIDQRSAFDEQEIEIKGRDPGLL